MSDTVFVDFTMVLGVSVGPGLDLRGVGWGVGLVCASFGIRSSAKTP